MRAPTSRKVFPNAEKLDHLKQWEQSRWQKCAGALKRADPAGFSAKGGEHPAIEEHVKKWLDKRTSWPGHLVTSGMVRVAAEEHASSKGTVFKASKAWCLRFRRRYSFVHVRMRGEMASADLEAAAAYPAQLKQLLTDLNLEVEQIYNCDETLLFPRLRSQYGVCPLEAARGVRGVKSDKSRFGMLLTTCADGHHRVPPMFAHTSITPHGMVGYTEIQKPLKMSDDGTHFYCCTHNGWISREIFSYYLVVVLPADIATKPTKRALLLIDGCSHHYTSIFEVYLANADKGDAGVDGAVAIDATGHVPTITSAYRPSPARTIAQQQVMKRIHDYGADITVGEVRLHVRVMPPRTSAAIQPCDQGLISWLKAQWRGELGRRLVSAESPDDAKKVLSGIKPMHVMSFLTERLRNISPEVGRKYWSAVLGSKETTHSEPVDAVTVVEGTLSSEHKSTWE
jgi:hypothetical protein